MAGLALSYEECVALRDAALRVPRGERSRALLSALRTLSAVLRSIQRARKELDREDDTPSPVGGPTS